MPAFTPCLRAAMLAAAATLCAPGHAALTPDATQAARGGGAWWSAFGDPLLDGLVARAAGSDTTQRAIVQAYVGVRTLQARAGLAERLLQAVARQRELLEASGAGALDRLLAALEARADEVRKAQHGFSAELDRVELTLAALSRTEPQHLHGQLAEGAGALPQVTWPVPFSLRASAQGDAAALPALQALSAQVQQAGELLQASELDLRARQLRQRAGAETPAAVLEAFQRLLADGDRLAITQGAMALAWAELLQALPADELPRLAAQQNAVRDTDPAPRAP